MVSTIIIRIDFFDSLDELKIIKLLIDDSPKGLLFIAPSYTKSFMGWEEKFT